MILNFRYHVFTITAIFIALGFGILIGVSLFGNEGLIAEQKKIIGDIGNQIKQLRNDNRSLRQELKDLEIKLTDNRQSQQELMSIFLDDYLAGNNYYLYSSSLSEKIIEEIDFYKRRGLSLQIIDEKSDLAFSKSNILNALQRQDRIVFWNTGQNEYKLEKLDINIGEEKVIDCREEEPLGLLLALVKHERFLRENKNKEKAREDENFGKK